MKLQILFLRFLVYRKIKDELDASRFEVIKFVCDAVTRIGFCKKVSRVSLHLAVVGSHHNIKLS